ncbi:MAG: nascent polypeptide-associated complex protein [Nanoarchaeota archaeon]
MIPGMGGLNPKKMQEMMKKLGINQEEIEAERVIIEKIDGGKIIIENPNVQKIKMQGQESWQITGEEIEENIEEDLDEEIREEDIKLVMAKTGKGRDSVKRVLEETDGDIAEAIVKLS